MAAISIPSVCQSVDTHEVPTFFSRYPAALSIGAKQVEEALHAIGEEASVPGSRERRRALIRHTNPYGDPFAICHCSAEPGRLVLLASIVEVMWIHDDVTEELEHHQACTEHKVLAEVLKIDINPSGVSAKNVRQSALAEVLRKAIDYDPVLAPKMIETLNHYLETFDNRDDDFDCMHDYIPFRVANCGYWISSFFIRWGMGISLSDEDYESIREYDFTMGNVLDLTNDYFSWNVEKHQPTDRIRNGVRVLMNEHNITSDVAKKLLLGVIVEEEAKAERLKRERLEKPVSDELGLYFEAIELYVGGSCYWHATAPRYQVFE